MDLPCEIRSVDSGIALSSNEKFVCSVLWEGLVEVLKPHEGVLALREVAMESIISSISWGEAHTGWAFDVQHVRSIVPRPRIRLQYFFSIVEYEGSVLLHESKKSGAAGAAIEPYQDRVIFCIVQRLNEHVMQTLSRRHVEEPTVPVSWQRSSIRNSGHLVGGLIGTLY